MHPEMHQMSIQNIVLLFPVPQNCIPYILVPNVCNVTVGEKMCLYKFAHIDVHGPRTRMFFTNCQIAYTTYQYVWSTILEYTVLKGKNLLSSA